MTMRHRLIRGSARRGLAMLSAAAMLTSMLAVPAFAEHYEDATVLEGDTAIEAALAWSGLFDSSDAVAIGRNDVFADNLSSGLIQGLGDGVPLLLTDTDALDQSVADEIERLGAGTAHVLGGEAAISADVEDELEDLGLTVHRHAGTTRIETAIDIASKHATDATSAILARSTASGTDESQAFADSLAAGAWAAESGMPILLTQSTELNDNLAAYLDGSSITDITIVGGTAAVSAAVAAELESMGITVDRVSGATRFETAVAVAEARGFDDASDATDGVIVVEGQDADSWAAGFAAAAFASNPKPIVLANGDTLPGPTETFLAGGTTSLFCGPLLDAAACDAAAVELGLDPATHPSATFISGPELTAATVGASYTTTTQLVRFDFDEDVVSTAISGGNFVLYTYDGTAKTASNAQIVAGNPKAVNAVFTKTEVAEATTAAVRFGAVQNSAGKQNPEGSAALQAVNLTSGQTTLPDVVSVTLDHANDRADIVFDVELDTTVATTAGHYKLVLSDAAPIDSTTTATIHPTNNKAIRVTFGAFDATQQGKVVRVVVGAGAVTEKGTANTNIAQSLVVANNGVTDRPTLLNATVDAANNKITMVFSESVKDTGITNTNIKAFDARGNLFNADATTPIDTAASTGSTLVVKFAANVLDKRIVGVQIAAAAIEEDQTTNKNYALITRGVTASSFSPGEISGPYVTGMTVTATKDAFGNVTGQTVTWQFSEKVTVNTAGNFYMYEADGKRTALTGALHATDTTKVEVALTKEQAEVAKLVTVLFDAVRDSSAGFGGTQGNYEAARGFTAAAS